MAPPFLAYHAIATNDQAAMHGALEQCLLYSDVLQVKEKGSSLGAWRHIVGPILEDLNLWAMGNAWAVGGMIRVLATVLKWLQSTTWKTEQGQLIDSIVGIIDAAVNIAESQNSTILHNVLDNTTWFEDLGSTAMMTAAIYRMAVLVPQTMQELHLKQAGKWRENIIAMVDHKTGRVSPTPQSGLRGWTVNEASTEGSSQGHSFVVMMISAHRDWTQRR
jgi:rhamnogalacturonyl hydrolase YesR